MKAAIYARYSSDSQREESIDAQIRAINDYAKKEGYIIVKIYTDEAYSAKTDDRPQFQQMIRDAGTKLFDVILVHKLDRFARNRYDSAYYKKQLKDAGIRLVSVLEKLDDSPESVILESLIEGLAEYYSKNLAREVMKGMKENALACKHTGGRPPFGFDIKDKQYVINVDEAAAVKKIFEMYLANSGYGKILKWLNENGFRTKRNEVFGKNSINAILANEKYTGVYIYNRTKRGVNSHKNKPEEEIIRILGGIPAIISTEIWKEVRIKMESNKHKGAAHKAKHNYLLSGLVRCGECGSAMTGNTRLSGQSKTKYSDYQCSGRTYKKSCTMPGIACEKLERMVIEKLQKDFFSEPAIDKLTDKMYDYFYATNYNAELESAQKELKEVEKGIRNIIEAVKAGLYNAALNEEMTVLEDKKNFYRNLISDMEKKAATPMSKAAIKQYLNSFDILNSDFDEKKQLINTFVESVIINKSTIAINTIVDLNGCGGAYRFILTMPNTRI
jgi:site-specific DNA recombinase